MPGVPGSQAVDRFWLCMTACAGFAMEEPSPQLHRVDRRAAALQPRLRALCMMPPPPACALACPCSAAFQHHFAASALSGETPSPSSYSRPTCAEPPRPLAPPLALEDESLRLACALPCLPCRVEGIESMDPLASRLCLARVPALAPSLCHYFPALSRLKNQSGRQTLERFEQSAPC